MPIFLPSQIRLHSLKTGKIKNLKGLCRLCVELHSKERTDILPPFRAFVAELLLRCAEKFCTNYANYTLFFSSFALWPYEIF